MACEETDCPQDCDVFSEDVSNEFIIQEDTNTNIYVLEMSQEISEHI